MTGSAWHRRVLARRRVAEIRGCGSTRSSLRNLPDPGGRMAWQPSVTVDHAS